MRSAALLACAVLVLVSSPACTSARYVATIRGPVLPQAAAAQGPSDPALDGLLEEARKDAEASGILASIHETIHVVIDGRVAYTATIANGKAVIVAGAPAGVSPTLTVPVTRQVLENLRAALADRRLDEAELFNFSYVLFVPCLRRLHGMFYFVEPGDKKHLLVDDFMQFRIKNPRGLTYHGQAVDVAATVLNVDGYFVHIPGLVGDPDVRYEFTLDEALALYRLLIYEAERQRENQLELVRIGRTVQGMLEKAVAYERAWH